jgi:transcriptional regulator GlxA family with amidase domain
MLVPMPRVVIVAFPGVQSLDVAGPAEVFGATGEHQVEVVAPEAGPVPSQSGLVLNAARALTEVGGPLDTLVIAGGFGIVDVLGDRGVIEAIRRLNNSARRLAAVCTGAFAIAQAGLLDGLRATTHWGYCEELAGRYPNVVVEPDAIYVRDGDVWTSAGVTAGIDLALAMVEDDLGREAALQIARRFVVFLKRPGGQSQFSAQLVGQIADRPPLRDLQAWIVEHAGGDLTVERLAGEVAMSPRNFSRAFRREVGVTPARFVERVRVDDARRRLEESSASVDEIAAGCGFGTAETMRRTFLRVLRVTPTDYRKRFRSRKESA